jgi:hypothetical protein
MKLLRKDESLIIEGNFETVKDAVLQCVKYKISLRGANLRGADLYGADLYGANLRGADLYGAKNIFTFNKENGRTCYAVRHDNGFMIKAGCFWGTLEEFEAACKETYRDNEKENYSAQIKYLKSL